MKIKTISLLVVLSILLITGCVRKEHSVPIINITKDNKNIQYRTLEDIHQLKGKFVSYEEYLRLSKKEF
jgi:hypothetical protein